jgi:hypothetical protein
MAKVILYSPYQVLISYSSENKDLHSIVYHRKNCKILVLEIIKIKVVPLVKSKTSFVS